jgi:hypothetical protein
MPKTQNIKGPFKNFLLKLYGDDVKRWGEVYWTAVGRGVERGEKVTETAVNEALLNMPGAADWLVRADERQYFCGKLKVKPKTLVDLSADKIARLYTDPSNTAGTSIKRSNGEATQKKR